MNLESEQMDKTLLDKILIMNKVYLTTKELSTFYDVSRQTIYNWTNQGMPSYKLKGTRRFKLEEVDGWLNIEKGEK